MADFGSLVKKKISPKTCVVSHSAIYL